MTTTTRTKFWTITALRDLAYLGAIFLWSIVAFTVLVTGVSVTASLLILVIGIFVWVGFAYVMRWTTAVDRKLAGWIRREPVKAVYQRPSERGVLPLVKTVTTDSQTWKDFGWLALNSIMGFVLGVVLLTGTAVVLGYVTMPIWYWSIPDPGTQYGVTNLGLFTIDTLGEAFAATGIGLALIPVIVLLNRAGVRGHAALAARVLRPSPDAALRARVQELTTSRADMVGAAQDQLERIERDLHDGAQARLVALAMELGMAEEDLERNPEAAAVAVRKARDEALNALAELRDLSRGIRPALLRERGLAAALEALSARTPLPTRLEVDRAVDRLPEAVQTAAYYVVAEALTNAAKHAHAYRVLVELERRDSILTITVSDDGVGGADPEGSGLAGLRTRVRALDGRLEVQSPSGGPTVVRAEIPCG